MPKSADEVKVILEDILRESKLERDIGSVTYRDDYQDYQVLVDGRFHCEIREKLIADYVGFNKNKDVVRNIRFLLEHAVEYEEWELEELDLSRQAQQSESDRIEIVDEDI